MDPAEASPPRRNLVEVELLGEILGVGAVVLALGAEVQPQPGDGGRGARAGA